MSTTALESVAWDLEPLVDGEGEAGADRLLDEADRRATAFAEPHAGKVAELDGPGLAAAMAELAGDRRARRPRRLLRDAALRRRHRRPRQRRAAAARPGARHGDRDQAAVLRPRVGGARRRRAPRSCSAADGLDHARHHLRTARRYRPHLLTEPEEKILAEKSVTGRDAWSRLFSEVTSAIKVDLDGEDEPVALDVALARLMSPDRELRAHVGRARQRARCSRRCASAATSSTR